MSVEKYEGETEALRALAATAYAGLVGECNLPETWADAFWHASAGERFSVSDLLPFRSDGGAEFRRHCEAMTHATLLLHRGVRNARIAMGCGIVALGVAVLSLVLRTWAP
jgi:hypothetical protein